MVYIVLKNGVVDEVFSTPEAAAAHKKNLLRQWCLTEIIVKEIKEI